MCVATKGSWHPTKNGDSGSLHVSEAKRSELDVKVRMQRRQADGNSFQSSCHLTGDVNTSEQRRPIGNGTRWAYSILFLLHPGATLPGCHHLLDLTSWRP